MVSCQSIPNPCFHAAVVRLRWKRKQAFQRCRDYFGPTCTKKLEGDGSAVRTVKVLRDTGCVQSLIIAGTLQFNDESSAGTDKRIRGIVGTDTVLFTSWNWCWICSLVGSRWV